MSLPTTSSSTAPQKPLPSYAKHNMDITWAVLEAWNSPHFWKRTAARVAISTVLPISLIAIFEVFLKGAAILIANIALKIAYQTQDAYTTRFSRRRVEEIPPQPEEAVAQEPLSEEEVPPPLPAPRLEAQEIKTTAATQGIWNRMREKAEAYREGFSDRVAQYLTGLLPASNLARGDGDCL